MDKILIAIVSIVTAFVQAVFGGHKSLPKAKVATTTEVTASASGQQNEVTPPPKPRELAPTEPVPKPTPPIKVSTTNINMNNLRYPNSTITSEGSGTLSLQSSDDADTITNWYKNKIRDMGMNSKSFVTTKTNDNVLNKLVGANGTSEVRVTISKDSGSAITKIEVNI